MKKQFSYDGFKLLVLFALAFFFGCKRELLVPNENGIKSSISIAEAKQYFETNIKSSGLSSAKVMSINGGHNDSDLSIQDIFNTKQALWNRAYIKQISIGKAVKVPLDFGKTSLIVNKSKREIIPFSSLHYLFMYKDSVAKIHTEWVQLMPDSSWLYGNRLQYTGEIIVKNWAGRIIKHYYFNKRSNSKIGNSRLGKLSSIEDEDPNPPSNSGGQSNPPVYICALVQVPSKCTCYDKNNCDWCPVCTIQTCAWIEPDQLEPDPTDPPYSPGGGSGSDEPGPGHGGGGSPSPGDYTPTNCNSDPNYVVPTTPPPPGEDWIRRCDDDIDIPYNPDEGQEGGEEEDDEDNDGVDFDEFSPVVLPTDFDLTYPMEWYYSENEFGLLSTELALQGVGHTDPIPEMYYKNGTGIDMTPASPIGGRTVKGAPRNNKYFWEQLSNKRPEMFSAKNRIALASKKWQEIVIDKQWVKYNPTHQSYIGGRIVHHHDEQGAMAYAIPEKVHQKWSKILHQFRRNGKVPRLGGTLNTLAGAMQIFSSLVDLNTGNPEAWINWFGSQNQIGRIYKDLEKDVYFQITKKVETVVNGTVTFAKVSYTVYADYVWDEDEHMYMGVQKLGTFVEDIDVVNGTSRDGRFSGT